MGVYGSENFKTLLLQFFMDQIQINSALTLGGLSQILFFRIMIFAFNKILWIFQDFLIMEVYGSQNFKTLLLLQFFMDQIQINSASTLGGPSQNLFLRILIFGFNKILKIFENSY